MPETHLLNWKSMVDVLDQQRDAVAAIPLLLVVFVVVVVASYGTAVGGWLSPFEFALGLAGVLPLAELARRTARRGFSVADGWRIAGVTLLGGVTASAVFLIVIYIERARGVAITDASTLVFTALFAGMLVSGPLAYQYYRLRDLATTVETELDEKSRLLTRLSVTDRVLRHNLRNQLTVIRGHTDLLAETVDDDLVDRHVTSVANATTELETLAEQASRIQRLFDAGAHSEQSISACLGAIAAAGTGEATNCTCIVDCPDELVVRARPELQDALSTLVTTLCENAMEEDGRLELHARTDSPATVRLRITLSMNVPETVLDPLCGEPEEALAHADDLRLWYVYWVVDLSGGRCTVTSGESETQISITLPVADTA